MAILTKRVRLLLLNAAFLFLVFTSLFLKIKLFNNAHNTKSLVSGSDGCGWLHEQDDKCRYVEANPSCKPKGYINYLHIFYCQLPPTLGYFLLLLWLVVLFYLLGSTAADYFCPSLERLSKTLNLPPPIAGITLLSLGNGAPDVFASVASFARSGDAALGLSTILGGAFFVSTVVVAIISLAATTDHHRAAPQLDRAGFVRDVGFFLFALSCLLVMLVARRVTLFCAVAFFSIYFFYVCSVSAAHYLCGGRAGGGGGDGGDSDNDDFCYDGIIMISTSGGSDNNNRSCGRAVKWLGKLLLRCLEVPLDLPRRVTIPLVTEERWSKPYAVVAAALAPLAAAFVCETQRGEAEELDGGGRRLVTYMGAGVVGIVLGNVAYVSTAREGPPKQCLFPWLVGGFVMSVTWTYVLAEELVALLFSLASVSGVSPAALGLTVLAWGNSLGDLIANVAMAAKGGPHGAQIAVVGCYAGPLFNTVVGVGFSLVMSAWSEYPEPYKIAPPRAESIYEAVGFLMVGLVWALVVLPYRKMRLDRLLGIGLLVIYSSFLLLRLAGGFGLVQLR